MKVLLELKVRTAIKVIKNRKGLGKIKIPELR